MIGRRKIVNDIFLKRINKQYFGGSGIQKGLPYNNTLLNEEEEIHKQFSERAKYSSIHWFDRIFSEESYIFKALKMFYK